MCALLGGDVPFTTGTLQPCRCRTGCRCGGCIQELFLLLPSLLHHCFVGRLKKVIDRESDVDVYIEWG